MDLHQATAVIAQSEDFIKAAKNLEIPDWR